MIEPQKSRAWSFQKPSAAPLLWAIYVALTASVGAVAFAAVADATPARTPIASEQTFLAGNKCAMARMMTEMTIKPTADVDHDFVAMMAPHHQGAIDMAVIYLRFGRNEKLRRLAQEIIVTQQQEIAAMRMAIDEMLPPSAPSPTLMSAALDRSSSCAMPMPDN